jgi:glycosyltransferase involved in cell wall biosynthesis
MATTPQPALSVVVPVYNEATGLPQFYASLTQVLHGLDIAYQVIFVDDGSTDPSVEVLKSLQKNDPNIHILAFTRNFGKEVATTAGMHAARGNAVITIDADGQHPVDRIPDFVAAWQRGAKVVVGRRNRRRASPLKWLGSRLFYGLFRRVTGIRMDANTTDFRLIDGEVQAAFNRMTEHRRITRGLIDWLGYERTYVPYAENPRLHGTATYSFGKFFKLAVDSAISLSISPLYITAYIGAVVLPGSVLLGGGMVLNTLVGDPLRLHATGGAYLMVFILFLIGILLVSQGIIGLYLSHIHTETQNRPLYILDETKSSEAPGRSTHA